MRSKLLFETNTFEIADPFTASIAGVPSFGQDYKARQPHMVSWLVIQCTGRDSSSCGEKRVHSVVGFRSGLPDLGQGLSCRALFKSRMMLAIIAVLSISPSLT